MIGTTLRHSDYTAMAMVLGAHGEWLGKPEKLTPAFERALANAPAVVDMVTSRAVASSDAQKGLGSVAGYQALTARDEAEQQRRSDGPTYPALKETMVQRGGTSP